MLVSMNSVSLYNQPNTKPNFKAQLSPKLHKALLDEARVKGADYVMKLNQKYQQVEKWGSENTILEKMQNELTKTASTISLNLKDFPKYLDTRLGVRQRLSLLEQFFSLKQSDIVNAEKGVFDKYADVELEAISNITESPRLLKLVTGLEEFEANRVAEAIEKLGTDEIFDFAKKSEAELVKKYGNK